MGGELSILNDIDAELLDAYIFTPGQGICLEKLCGPFNNNKSVLVFKKGLGYGSWYDVLVRINCSGERQAYMSKGVYLSVNKRIPLSELLCVNNRVDGDDKPEWQCKNEHCKEWNENGVNICLHCYTNYARGIVRGLSFIPVIGLPFSITHAVLETGRASHTGETHDKVSAGVAIGAAALDIVLTPVFVGSIVKIPAIAAAKTGTELGAKTLLTQTGKVAGTMAVKKVTNAIGTKTAGIVAGEVIAEASRSTNKRDKKT